jgi:hypothetical protein
MKEIRVGYGQDAVATEAPLHQGALGFLESVLAQPYIAEAPHH